MNIFNRFFSTVNTDLGFLLPSLFVSLFFVPAFSFASATWNQIYVYEKPDGDHVITGTKMNNKGFSLVKTYRAKKASKTRGSLTTKKRKGSRCDLHHIKKKAAAYKHTITIYSKMYKVDEALVMAIIKNESCFKVNARSRVGAIGLMQLMPDTAKYLQVSNPWNPKQNIQGGVKYIAEMLRMFKGNKRLALAAYNAGPANVRKYKGIPPFKETRTYVTRVMNDYKKLKASGLFSL